MSSPESILFKDLLLETKDGDWGQGEPAEGLLPYHVIRATDFASTSLGDVGNVPLRYLPKHTVERRTLALNDILIETAGGSPGRPTGRTMLVTQRVMNAFDGAMTCASFARFLRVDRERVDPRYVYWFLQSLYESGEIEQYQVQHTGVARFQFTQFAGSQEVSVPEESTQRAIAEVLGALDDKIAANTKLVTTTMKLAEAHFVRAMRDVGEMVSLGQVVSLEYGKSLPTSNRIAGPVAVYGSGGVVGSHVEALCPDPGVVVGRKGTAGAVHWSHRAFFPIDTTFYVVPKRESMSQVFAYFLLRTLRLDEMNNDSAVPGLNRSQALATSIRLPSEAVMRGVTETATDLFRVAAHVEQQNRTLVGTRTVLLPQLMSGKLRVKDAEKVLENAGG